MKHVYMFSVRIPRPIHSKIDVSDWSYLNDLRRYSIIEDSEGLKVVLLQTNIVRLAYKII